MTDLQLTSEAARLTNELAEHPSHIISAGAGTRVEREVVLPISNQQLLVLEIIIQESSRDTARLRKATAYIAKSAISLPSPEWIQPFLTASSPESGSFPARQGVVSHKEYQDAARDRYLRHLLGDCLYTDISIRRQDT